jgi:hypothetical protein
MPYVSIMQIIDSQMRAFTSLFNFPIWFSMTPSPHRGSTLTYPAWPRTRDVWPGAPSFEHRVCSPSSVRAQRQKPFPPLVAEAARGRDRGSPPLEQGCEARSRCRNLLGRDRYRPPVQFSCGDSLAQCSRPRPGSWCLVRIRGMHAAKPAPIMHSAKEKHLPDSSPRGGLGCRRNRAVGLRPRASGAVRGFLPSAGLHRVEYDHTLEHTGGTPWR